jgi:hypothetical protein
MIQRNIVIESLCALEGEKSYESVLRVLRSLGLESFSDARRILSTENPIPHTADFVYTNKAKMVLCFAEIDEMNKNIIPVSTPPQTQRQAQI